MPAAVLQKPSYITFELGPKPQNIAALKAAPCIFDDPAVQCSVLWLIAIKGLGFRGLGFRV